MPVTIFTIPKPFEGHIGIIQRNAIESWTRLGPDFEIVLCGDEQGTAAFANELDVRHIPSLERNELGTPYVSEAFDAVRRASTSPWLCYINADIILTSDFRRAVQRLPEKPCLLVGRRWDYDLTVPLDFSQPDWEQWLCSDVAQHGEPHSLWGIDYFMFPREAYATLPPLLVGRPGWDNWMIFEARRLRMPVIDGSDMIRAIHQNHDYSHVRCRTGEKWVGVEGNAQIRLLTQIMGGSLLRFAIVDRTHVLTEQGPRRDRSLRALRRGWETTPVLHRWLRPVSIAGTPLVRCVDYAWHFWKVLSGRNPRPAPPSALAPAIAARKAA